MHAIFFLHLNTCITLFGVHQNLHTEQEGIVVFNFKNYLNTIRGILSFHIEIHELRFENTCNRY